MKQSLPKKEIIRKKNLIKACFQKGKKLKVKSLKVVYTIHDEQNEAPVQALFSVPKKVMKLAVDRNRKKRQLKESFRKNKVELSSHFNNENKGLSIIFIYLGKKDIASTIIEANVKLALDKIIENEFQKDN